ncbi:Tetratricopeptide repeat-containing protein [Sphingomonas gellani]|uniref:Tetratricopeptide repeat-containing protein n=1 Tax=Sphingomonas gellani TaxID=1166340 RepID=A0A1H8G4C0_9SPHN|nr:tetratricopeptide repeat protein [Sphingomonas gellani]SEN38941.1 Tetratricopeptide repeat-containing protein [Sphingomonas gellani]
MILPLLLLSASVPADPAFPDRCLEWVRDDPAKAVAQANRWKLEGGGVAAQQCVGLAEAAQDRWPAAAAAFEAAARAAEVAHDPLAATCWAQAGNAWLAGGDPARARTALDTALSAGTLSGQPLGEARLDRARAAVAAGDTRAARDDLDAALAAAPDDPLAWLLSATLARRQGDLPRAKADIAQALRRSADDASVQLEAGNIAASAGDETGARAAWTEASRLAPDDPRGRSAQAALKQFETPAKP